MKTISWIGTVASIFGSFLVAFNLQRYGYPVFIIGSTSWLYVGIKQKDFALVTLNGVFFFANIIGLCNNWSV